MFTLQTCIDILFPPPPESQRLRQWSETRFITHYHLSKQSDWIALSQFSNPVIHDAVIATKFQNNQSAARLLGSLLRRWLVEQTYTYTVVPIPLHRSRYYERGFNQVERIVQAALPDTAAVMRPGLLKKSRSTPHQTSLNRTERLTNVENVFTTSSAAAIANQHILIVDDVVTTGATLSAAKAALLPHTPASVTCLALAH